MVAAGMSGRAAARCGPALRRHRRQERAMLARQVRMPVDARRQPWRHRRQRRAKLLPVGGAQSPGDQGQRSLAVPRLPRRARRRGSRAGPPQATGPRRSPSPTEARSARAPRRSPIACRARAARTRASTRACRGSGVNTANARRASPAARCASASATVQRSASHRAVVAGWRLLEVGQQPYGEVRLACAGGHPRDGQPLRRPPATDRGSWCRHGSCDRDADRPRPTHRVPGAPTRRPVGRMRLRPRLRRPAAIRSTSAACRLAAVRLPRSASSQARRPKHSAAAAFSASE